MKVERDRLSIRFDTSLMIIAENIFLRFLSNILAYMKLTGCVTGFTSWEYIEATTSVLSTKLERVLDAISVN